MRGADENIYDLTRYRSRRQDRERGPREKGDFLISVIRVQCVVCALLLLWLFVLYKMQGESFSRLRDFYNTMSEKDLSAEELAAAFKDAAHRAADAVRRQAGRLGGPDSSGGGGVGGDDLLAPGENASFSPVVLTRRITPPVCGARVSSKFGYRADPVTGKAGFHSGVDLAIREGAPITAAFGGRVVKASRSPGRGWYLILEHPGGLQTVYCHCKALLIKEGDAVSAGETIAEVGSTGRSTGPHLHFELLLNGVRCDPLWVLNSQ